MLYGQNVLFRGSDINLLTLCRRECRLSPAPTYLPIQLITLINNAYEKSGRKPLVSKVKNSYNLLALSNTTDVFFGVEITPLEQISLFGELPVLLWSLIMFGRRFFAGVWLNLTPII